MYISRHVFVLMVISTIATFVTLILVTANLSYIIGVSKCLESQNVSNYPK